VFRHTRIQALKHSNNNFLSFSIFSTFPFVHEASYFLIRGSKTARAKEKELAMKQWWRNDEGSGVLK
jgi:hypothetical protein